MVKKNILNDLPKIGTNLKERMRRRNKILDLSIVVPCFNEEQNIPLLSAEIHKEISNLNLQYEILFIDDGSTDSTATTLRFMSKKDDRVSFLVLRNNNGHQTALTKGIKASRGKVVIAMDADFQHSPKYLPIMYNIWKMSGVDVIQTRRKDFSPSESLLKKNLSRLFYKFVNIFFSSNLVEGGADFRLIGPKVVSDIKRSLRSSIFHRGFCAKPDYSQVYFEIDVQERRFGFTKYTLMKQFKLAYLGIIELLHLNDKFKVGFVEVEISDYHMAQTETEHSKAS
jgi:dolichol-phosphate mannosyltransferase